MAPRFTIRTDAECPSLSPDGTRVAYKKRGDRARGDWRLAVLDIAPTWTMFMDTDRHVAGAYWHWYFLSLPAPFPERMIGADPDYFFETCFETWGKTPVSGLDPEVLAQYRRCWRRHMCS